MGEEWRRGWHPEIIAPKKSDKEVMIVGAGPAGLEAARGLGQRGYHVILLEARKELGGRVLRESALPGLERMAPRDGLAADADQKDEERGGLSLQPDDCRRRSWKPVRRILSSPPAHLAAGWHGPHIMEADPGS